MINQFGNEDCLFLNIYKPGMPVWKSYNKSHFLQIWYFLDIPSNNSTNLLPVCIVIYGGGYTTGSSNDLRPDFLLNQADMIIVRLAFKFELNLI